MDRDALELQIGTVYTTKEGQKVVVEGFYVLAEPTDLSRHSVVTRMKYIDKGTVQYKLPDVFDIPYDTFINRIANKWGKPDWEMDTTETLTYLKLYGENKKETSWLDG